LFVAAASGVALVWRHPLAEIAARSAAPIGAVFTFLCLATGSLWGTWWVWDARLTSVLVLFFLYLGYITLVNGFDDPARGGRAGSVLALVGVVNLPIIKFSVDWWNTLHRPASVLRLGKPTIVASMLAGRHDVGDHSGTDNPPAAIRRRRGGACRHTVSPPACRDG
jgi:heme exporter protein C